MGLLKKSSIVRAADRRQRVVSVPEWGGDVLLIAPSAADGERFLAGFASGGNLDGRKLAELVCMCLCNEDGTRMFADGEVDEFARTHSIEVVRRLWEECAGLCGFGAEGIEAAKKN